MTLNGVNPCDLAERYLGLREIAGSRHDPLVVAMIRQAGGDPALGDETAWCGAFVAWIAWHLGLPIPSFPLRARAWLLVGEHVDLAAARRGDVIVLSRGANPPPASVIMAPGHVGFFEHAEGSSLEILGGNQGDAVSVAPFPDRRVLGVRRLRA